MHERGRQRVQHHNHAPIIHDFLCYNNAVERNYSDLLEKSIDAARLELLHLLAYEASMLQMPVYIVGGGVRDILLGRPVNDFDLVVEGNAIELAEFVLKKIGGRVVFHSRFGTATWILNENVYKHLNVPVLHSAEAPASLDLISARSEIYLQPGALPTVTRSAIEDDLRRRDFTINAMAIQLDGHHFGELLDPLDGESDLRGGIIRVLHPRSFIDDPTRMYRAVRYEGRYGFKIAEDTLVLIPEARAFVEKLSAQRIRHELDLILEEPNAASMLARLDELDLLSVVHPALSNFNQSNLAHLESDDAARQNRNSRWILWLMHLHNQEIELLNARLHFTADLLKLLRSASLLNANLNTVVGLKPSESVQLLDSYSLRAIDVISHIVQDIEIKNILTKYLSEWRHVKPKTTGHDLTQRGVQSGPKYAEILRRLRAAWLDGEIRTETEEKTLLNNLLSKP